VKIPTTSENTTRKVYGHRSTRNHRGAGAAGADLSGATAVAAGAGALADPLAAASYVESSRGSIATF